MFKMEAIETFSRDIYVFVQEHRIAVTCVLASVCGYFALKRYIQGPKCKSKVRMDGRTVLITGANTGIGKETARDMARRGARVLLACRDMTRAEKAAEEIRKSTGNSNVVVYKLDLASLKSVRQCAKEVLSKEKRLDVLINNAGVMWIPQWKTEDGYEMQFGTNHLGHFLLTDLLLDLLKKSAPSRIVTVSSVGHKFAYINFDDLNSEKSYSPVFAYSQSKVANILHMRELGKRLKGTGVTTYSLHPGAVDTELTRFMDHQILPLKILYNMIYYVFFKPFIKSSAQGAQTTIYCAVDPDLDNVTGKYFSDCAIGNETADAKNDETAAKLWTVSEEMVGLTQKS